MVYVLLHFLSSVHSTDYTYIIRYIYVFDYILSYLFDYSFEYLKITISHLPVQYFLTVLDTTSQVMLLRECSNELRCLFAMFLAAQN